MTHESPFILNPPYIINSTSPTTLLKLVVLELKILLAEIYIANTSVQLLRIKHTSLPPEGIPHHSFLFNL